MNLICRVAKVNRSSYYAWLNRPPSAREKKTRELTARIKSMHLESRGTYGAPRLTQQLRSQGQICNEKRVAKIMRELRIYGCARRKYRPISITKSNPNWPVSPRLFKIENKEALPQAPNQVWVSDVTYVPTKEGWLFLTMIMDLYSRKIVGYWMSDHQRSEHVWEAMKLGICSQKESLSLKKPALLIHSDRGGQYASEFFREKLRRVGITQSMSRSGNCYDNAYAESFFHTLKIELVHRIEFKTRVEAQNAIQDYIDSWYNCKRLHSGLGYQSPCDYEQKALVG